MTGAPHPHSVHRRLAHGLEPDDPKKRVARIVDSHLVDVIIFVLVMLDLLCVSVETSIDLHLVCVKGQEVHLPPQEVVALLPAEHKGEGEGKEAVELLNLENIGFPGRHGKRKETLVGWQLSTPGSSSQSLAQKKKQPAKTTAAGRFLQTAVDAFHAHDKEEEEEPGAIICENRDGPNAVRIAETFHYLSILILTVMLAELFAKIYVSPSGFFSNPWMVLDLVVVSVSWVFDVFEEGLTQDAIELVIIMRLWRCIRIIHGSWELMESEEERVNSLNEKIEELEAKNEKLQAENTKGAKA